MAIESTDPQAQLAEVVAGLGPRLRKDETPAQAVTRLVAGCALIVQRCDEYFASARSNAQENERLTAELAHARGALEALCNPLTTYEDKEDVFTAVLGICEHEHGPAVLRYVGHLERLLKEARAENERLENMLTELQDQNDGAES